MALYPAAVQKRLSTRFSGNQRMVAHNRVNLHVAVSLASSLHGYFNAPYRPSSHFYVRKSGVVEQYVDTDWRAEADGDGNDATISVETQGGLTNPNGEKWTAAQVEALAKLYVWAVKTHGIELKLATSSKLGWESKGLSWHRLGIDGNFGSGILRGRSQRGGGMHYSKSFGKICPGDAKIKQIPGIFLRAKKILAGGASGSDSNNTKDWFDMATKADLRDVVLDAMESGRGQRAIGRGSWTWDGIPAPDETDTKKNKNWTPGSFLRNIRWHAKTHGTRIEKRVVALEAALDALSREKGVDPAEIRATVAKSVDRALADLSVTLTNEEV